MVIVPQNGEALLEVPHYLETIDAIAKESLLTGASGTAETANSERMIERSARLLERARLAAGLVAVTGPGVVFRVEDGVVTGGIPRGEQLVDFVLVQIAGGHDFGIRQSRLIQDQDRAVGADHVDGLA